jgi:hypothetical protein
MVIERFSFSDKADCDVFLEKKPSCCGSKAHEKNMQEKTVREQAQLR